MTAHETLKEYRNGSLKDKVIPATEASESFPTASDFIEEYKAGNLTRNDLEDAEKALRLIADICNKHAQELTLYKRQRSRGMKPGKMRLHKN